MIKSENFDEYLKAAGELEIANIVATILENMV